MKALILGASGLVGGNCLRHFTEQGWQAVGTHLSHATADTVPFNTLDPEAADNYDVASFQPDVIVHCGALTWVDYCEQHPEESYEKTVTSTENVIALAKSLHAKLVYISTDYVFDGEAGPYPENHPVNPVNIYGKHKLEAETKVREALPDNHLVIRITNVYGDEERNKNFVARMVQNAQKDEAQSLKLPYDQYATPCNALDIARAMFLLLQDGKTGVYNVASTDWMNRVQLAKKVLAHFPEHQVDITPVDTATFNPPAPRPLVGGLITAKFLAEYPDFVFTNVDDYLTNKQG